MNSINALAAAELDTDLRRAAERWRRGRTSGPTGDRADAVTATVALRLAQSDDTHIVRRLAALDDARPLDGQALLALIDGEAVAALSLRDARVVANPFTATDEAVSLLRLRAVQMWGGRARRRWRAIPRLRLA